MLWRHESKTLNAAMCEFQVVETASAKALWCEYLL